jgi:hypothetical protein
MAKKSEETKAKPKRSGPGSRTKVIMLSNGKTEEAPKSSNEQILPEPLGALIDILAKQTAKEHHEKIYGVRIDRYSFAAFKMKSNNSRKKMKP